MIGRSVQRVDGPAKAAGRAVYTIDRVVPGMLHAKLLRSPEPSARIVALDAERARRLPGVHAVVTGADTPRRTGMFVADQHLLARDVVRFAGEPVAALAAETEAQAYAALAAIELELEPLPVVADPHQALAGDAPLVHPDWADYSAEDGFPREGNLLNRSELVRGDVAAAFARDDVVVVEDVTDVPRQHQSYLEPRCAVAWMDGDRYVIHSSTQFPYKIRERTADALGVRPSAIRVVVDAVGGGFGGKLDTGPEPIAALLASRAGRPVRLAYTRGEEFVAATMRENATIRMRSAVTREGEIVAQTGEVLLDAGAYAGETVWGGIPIALATAYRIPDVHYTTRAAYTNTPPTGAFRGICGPYMVLAVEQHMDHIARELGADRLALRRRHAYRSGDTYPNGQVIEDSAFADALDRLEEVAPWAETSRRRPYRGVGVGIASWLTNPMAGSATVKVNEDGTVDLITAATDIGTGAVAAGMVQLVAADLGVAAEDVIVRPPDTDVAPFDAGAQGSRTLYNAGNAALKATAELRERLTALAADRFEADPADIELADGAARVRGVPSRTIPIAALAQAALDDGGPLAATGSSVSVPATLDPGSGCVGSGRDMYFNAPTFHAHLAEVEVDPDTGQVAITRYVVVQDVGRAINPSAIEGQIHGAVAQGIGYALYEDITLRDGLVAERLLEDYRLPGAPDVPRIETILIEHPSPAGPHGAKGVAEPPILLPAAVLSCAIADAIGQTIPKLPITPFDVLAILRERDREPVEAAS